MNDKVYIVSSFHRSGSSMMMRCLEAGGLSAVCDKSIDVLLNSSSVDGYVPNPNGFYQFNREVYPDFCDEYKGKVVKLYFKDLMKLQPEKCSIVFVVRDPNEIRASMKKWTPYKSWGSNLVATYFMDEILSMLQDKFKDITILNYADIIKDPETEFSKLNFPIDVKKSAGMVQPELYRLKLENK